MKPWGKLFISPESAGIGKGEAAELENEESIMKKVSVVIPNYNGKGFLEDCLGSLENQSFSGFETILVDDGSTDGSAAYVRERFPGVRIISMEENGGFCRAVNRGIQASSTPFVILLNNDVKADKDFVKEMLAGIRRHKRCFSCSAQLRNMHRPDLIDDAGDYYCALGWAFALGKDKPLAGYQKPRKIFASCGGAAIYRKAFFEKTGYFDEKHFAYLEDIDVGYRARIYGYENLYLPKAVVYHAGSGTTGSRYNEFKVRHSSRNNIYMIYKNMPFLQILLNLPFLIAGFLAKLLFFAEKGYGGVYLRGLAEGISMSMHGTKVPFQAKYLKNYVKIQMELWFNILRKVRS